MSQTTTNLVLQLLIIILPAIIIALGLGNRVVHAMKPGRKKNALQFVMGVATTAALAGQNEAERLADPDQPGVVTPEALVAIRMRGEEFIKRLAADELRIVLNGNAVDQAMVDLYVDKVLRAAMVDARAAKPKGQPS